MKKLILDFGHGGQDTGCISVNGNYEKNLNLDLGLDIYNILKKYIDVTLTRNADVDFNLNKRAKFCKDNSPAYLFSFHFNAFNKKSKGIEIFTSNFTSDTNKDFASFLCKEFSRKFGFENRGAKTRQLDNGNDYYCLHRETGENVTCFIVETCFIDNKEDFALLNKIGLDKIAEFYAYKILDFLEINYTSNKSIEQWKLDEVIKAVKNGYIDNDNWKNKINDNIPVWAAFEMINDTHEKYDKIIEIMSNRIKTLEGLISK